MPRDITSAANTALGQSHVTIAIFIELNLGDYGVLRLSNSLSDRVWDGETWIGGGRFTAIQPIEETSAPSSAALTLVISGIETSYVQAIMEEHYQGSPARVWVAPMDADEQVIADPILVFQGFMDEPSINLGATADINITLENRWADWDRPRLRRYNQADQASVYPGDRGLEYAEQIEIIELAWGSFKGPPKMKIPLPKWLRNSIVTPVAKFFRKLF